MKRFQTCKVFFLVANYLTPYHVCPDQFLMSSRGERVTAFLPSTNANRSTRPKGIHPPPDPPHKYSQPTRMADITIDSSDDEIARPRKNASTSRREKQSRPGVAKEPARGTTTTAAAVLALKTAIPSYRTDAGPSTSTSRAPKKRRTTTPDYSPPPLHNRVAWDNNSLFLDTSTTLSTTPRQKPPPFPTQNPPPPRRHRSPEIADSPPPKFDDVDWDRCDPLARNSTLQLSMPVIPTIIIRTVNPPDWDLLVRM